MLKVIKTKESLYKLVFFVLPMLVLCGLTLIRPNVIQNIENLFLSVHIRQTNLPPINENVIIILGDDQSVAKLGEWPWKREVHARLLNEWLYKARTVAFDIMFLEESLYGGDEDLADAIKRHGNVVLSYVEAAANVPETYSIQSFIENSAGEGYTNGYNDEDGITRRYRFFINKGNGIVAPSFVCSILMASGYKPIWDYHKGGCKVTISNQDGMVSQLNLDGDNELIRLPAPIGNFSTYSYVDVIEGKIPPEAFEDAIVLVGFSATGTSDLVTTATGIEYGAKFQMDSLYTVLTGFGPTRVSSVMEALITTLLFLLCAILTYLSNNRFSFLIPITLSMGWLFLTNWLFINNIAWISAFPQILSTLLAYLCTILYKLVLAQRDLRIRAMSVDSLLSVTSGLSDVEDYNDFKEYMKVLAPEIESSSGISIVNPMIEDGDVEYKKFPTKTKKEGLIIAYNAGSGSCRHLILLKLPFLDDGNSRQQYALLGMNGRVPPATVKSVAALIVTAYVYYNASREAKKRYDVFYNLLSCIISAIDAKDPITSGHSHRVARLAEQLACWMELPKPVVNDIQLSGLIHDVGKIGIPDHVLAKKGPLSDEEYETIKTHPEIGGSIMEVANLSPNILDGILYHHERPDGKGYPFGKGGEELSVSANIIKVADVFDALNNERHYKKAWTLDRILNLLYKGRGREFDGTVVDVLIGHMKPEDWKPMSSEWQKEVVQPREIIKCLEKVEAFLSLYKETDYMGEVGPDKDPFDFNCTNTFGGMEWHGAFYQKDFMEKKPVIHSVDEKSTSFIIKDADKCLLYYFLNDYLTMGAVISDMNKKGILEMLTNIYGKSKSTENGTYVWDTHRMLVFMREEEKQSNYWVAYAMKSILEGS